MASCNFQAQLVSIMEVLAKAAVAEINNRVDDSCAVIRLEMTQSQRDIDLLKRKCQMMEIELKTRGRVRRKEISSYPVKIVLNKPRSSSQWRDGEMAFEEDSQHQPTDVEQRLETEPILIKDEETAEDVWKTDPQEELRITGEESGSKPGKPQSFEQRHCDEDFLTQPNVSPEDSVEHYPNSDHPEEPGTPRLTSTEVLSTEQHRPAEDEDSLDLVTVKDEKEEELDQTTTLAGPDQFVMDETDGQLWTSVDPSRDTNPDGHPDFSFHSTEEFSPNISVFPSHSGLTSVPTMTDDVGPSLHSSIWKPHANMFSAAKQQNTRHVRTLADETRQQMPEGQSSERLNSINEGNGLALQPKQHQCTDSEATVRFSECLSGSNIATTSPFSGYSLSRSSFNMVKRMRSQWRSGGTNERRFSCTFCGKSFPRFWQLKEHLRSHTGEKPYTCEQCGRSFTKQCNLIRHAVVHSGEKPYKCTHCGKCFPQRSGMKSHQRTHIGESPVSQYVVPTYPGDPQV